MSIYLHANEKTLVLDNPDNVAAGTVIQFDKGDSNGEQAYLVVDNDLIKTGDKSTGITYNDVLYSYSNLITTKVTSMRELFKNARTFKKRK